MEMSALTGAIALLLAKDMASAIAGVETWPDSTWVAGTPLSGSWCGNASGSRSG
jgi:hypothetical protein